MTRVYTELAVLARSAPGEELTLAAVHAGVSVDQVVRATGWDLRIADDVRELPPPTAEELRLLRDEIDPRGVYLR